MQGCILLRYSTWQQYTWKYFQYFVSVNHILYREEYKHCTVQYISIQYMTTRKHSLIHNREYKELLEMGDLLVSSPVSGQVNCELCHCLGTERELFTVNESMLAHSIVDVVTFKGHSRETVLTFSWLNSQSGMLNVEKCLSRRSSWKWILQHKLSWLCCWRNTKAPSGPTSLSTCHV